METCAFCRAEITDGREESGYTGAGPDWMDDGDYGCNSNPMTNEEGCGGHRTKAEVRELVAVAETEERWAPIWDVVRERLYGVRPALMLVLLFTLTACAGVIEAPRRCVWQDLDRCGTGPALPL